MFWLLIHHILIRKVKLFSLLKNLFSSNVCVFLSFFVLKLEFTLIAIFNLFYVFMNKISITSPVELNVC